MHELHDFLRARRDRIKPEDVGLPVYGRRRVPGLRREEVAALAGVSTDYYTKFEQGHGSGVSDPVLDAIARVLRLDDTERAHLRRLAKATGGRLRASEPLGPVRRGVRDLLRLMPGVPAVVLGPRFEPLAWNDLADGLFGISGAEGGSVHQIFLDPAARIMYPRWEEVAEEVVGFLRLSAGRDPGDEVLDALVRELSAASPEFRALWGRQFVRDKTYGRKVILHPVVGLLDLAFETFRLPDDERLTLMTYAADPGSPSEERLQNVAECAMFTTRGSRDHRAARP